MYSLFERRWPYECYQININVDFIHLWTHRNASSTSATACFRSSRSRRRMHIEEYKESNPTRSIERESKVMPFSLQVGQPKRQNPLSSSWCWWRTIEVIRESERRLVHETDEIEWAIHTWQIVIPFCSSTGVPWTLILTFPWELSEFSLEIS